MIVLENVLERMKIYSSYNGLESYASVCNENIYFCIVADTQM